MTDEDYIRLAIDEAQEAALAGEVPVGAILVCGGIAFLSDRTALCAI